MATGGRREEIDAKIKAWERELEQLRLELARAPESLHDRYHKRFTELYLAKEVVKSRWETIRGVYRPDAAAIKSFDEALAAMEAAWAAAQSMVAEIRKPRAA